jgi:hypothetical protein
MREFNKVVRYKANILMSAAFSHTRNSKLKPVMVRHAYNPSTQKAVVGIS